MYSFNEGNLRDNSTIFRDFNGINVMNNHGLFNLSFKRTLYSASLMGHINRIKV